MVLSHGLRPNDQDRVVLEVAELAPIYLVSVQSLVEFTHRCGQLTDQLIQLSLLVWLRCITIDVIVVVLLILNRILAIVVLTFIDCLACKVVVDILLLTHKLMDLLSEISSTQRAFSFDFEPFLSTLFVEVVLWVAFEHHQLVFFIKRKQADRAVWHIEIFLLVLRVTHAWQTFNVPLQRQLPWLLCGFKQSPFYVI